MHKVFALLCFVVVIHWLIFPYPSGLLHWHCGNLTIVPVPAKQPWWIWINTSCKFIMNDCITTTKQSTTQPCAYFLGYTVLVSFTHSVYVYFTDTKSVMTQCQNDDKTSVVNYLHVTNDTDDIGITKQSKKNTLCLFQCTNRLSNSYLTAVYLTSDICVSALSMVIQMAVLNVYHKVPLTPVPEWLKALIRRLSYISGSGRAEEAPVNEDQKEKDGKEVNKTTEATNRKQLVDEGSGILNKVSKITEKMESHFAGEELREEWKIVGRVFDRVCFFIFITVHLIIFVIGIARVWLCSTQQDKYFRKVYGYMTFRYVWDSMGRKTV